MNHWANAETMKSLRDTIATLPSPYRELCNGVVNDDYFRRAPAAKKQHHAYPGGLAEHTREVVQNAEKMCGPGVDRNVVITAAVWHDYAKIHEYGTAPDGAISDRPYRKLVGHVVGSYYVFMEAVAQWDLPLEAVAAIGHCILAHHGRREWGSPVEPATVEANIVHVADMMSARG